MRGADRERVGGALVAGIGSQWALLIDAVSFGGMVGDALTVSVHLSTFLRSAV